LYRDNDSSLATRHGQGHVRYKKVYTEGFEDHVVGKHFTYLKAAAIYLAHPVERLERAKKEDYLCRYCL